MAILSGIKNLYRTIRDQRDFNSSTALRLPQGFLFKGYRNFDFGKFEVEESALLTNLLKETDLFIDIGANIGFYSCLACQNNVPVIAFEPDSNNVRFLLRNIKLNGKESLFSLYQMGLSDTKDIVRLYGGKTAASLIKNWSNADDDYFTDIFVNRLDDVIGDRFNGKRILVKIDVEGLEFNVLSAAGYLLRNNPRPKFFVEITYTEHRKRSSNPHFLKTFEIFWDLGYTCRAGKPDGAIITKEMVTDFINGKIQHLSENGNYLFE